MDPILIVSYYNPPYVPEARNYLVTVAYDRFGVVGLPPWRCRGDKRRTWKKHNAIVHHHAARMEKRAQGLHDRWTLVTTPALA